MRKKWVFRTWHLEALEVTELEMLILDNYNPLCNLSHLLHVWYIYHYLPTFGWFLGQMLVNIPYMEHLGMYQPINNDFGHCWFSDTAQSSNIQSPTGPCLTLKFLGLHKGQGTKSSMWGPRNCETIVQWWFNQEKKSRRMGWKKSLFHSQVHSNV